MNKVNEVKCKINPHFFNLLNDWDFDIMLYIGGYGSGKSHEVFTKLVKKCKEEVRRVMIIRKEFVTLKDSCYEDVEDAIERLALSQFVRSMKSPLKHYFSNGSEILYRGLDKKSKIKSIKNIDLIVVEEANENSIENIKELISRLRTKDKKCHIILMTNPGNETDSIKQLFFNEYQFDIEELYQKRQLEKISKMELNGRTEEIKIKVHHSTYQDNIKHLSPIFVHQIENEPDEDLRTIAKEGRYGKTRGTVFLNIYEERGVYEQIKTKNIEWYNGQDFGVSVSYDVLVKCAVDRKENILYIYDGLYKRGMSTDGLIQEMLKIVTGHDSITADSEDPRMIKDLKVYGFRVNGAVKGPGSVKHGIGVLKSFSKIIIDSKLKDMVTEDKGQKRGIFNDFFNLARKKLNNGDYSEDEYVIDPHAVDATRYALEQYKRFDYKDKVINKPY